MPIYFLFSTNVLYQDPDWHAGSSVAHEISSTIDIKIVALLDITLQMQATPAIQNSKEKEKAHVVSALFILC